MGSPDLDIATRGGHLSTEELWDRVLSAGRRFFGVAWTQPVFPPPP
jgi:hypothetical protein